MSEWIENVLSNLTTKIGSGATPRGGQEAYKKEGISLIRSQNILDFRFSISGLALIDVKQADKLKNVTLESEDILINITGDSVARVCKVPINLLPARVNQHVSIIRANKKLIHPDYLLYYLLNPIIKKYLLKIASDGATRNSLTKLDLEELIVRHPKGIFEQLEITKTLSNLDQKITLLRQQNETLEQLAQTLFKRWFVEFEYPSVALAKEGVPQPYKSSGGKMINSELGEIPVGWRVGTLGEEFEILMGQSPPGSSFNTEKEGVVFYQGRTDFGFRFPTNRLYTTEPKRIASKFDVLVSVRAPVGDTNMATEECCIGRGIAAVKSDSKSYCFNKIKSLKKLFDIFEKEGTVFGSLSKTDFNDLEVVVPTNTIKNSFEETVFKIDLKIFNNELEIQTLTQLRDTLLPKLMSGELRVKM